MHYPRLNSIVLISVGHPVYIKSAVSNVLFIIIALVFIYYERFIDKTYINMVEYILVI